MRFTRTRLVICVLALVGCGSGDRGDSGDGLGGNGSPDPGSDDGSGDGGGDGPGDGTRYDVEGDGTGGDETDEGGPADCEEVAQTASNQGCEFWAVDLPQPWWAEGGGPNSPADATYAVAVANASSNLDAEVLIFEGAGATVVESATIAVGDLHVFELPPLSIDAQASSTGGLAYRIETSVPVTAYQFNTLEQATSRFSADASLLFPTHVLRGDYTTLTGDAFHHDGSEIGAFIAVVGVEDGTTVDVFPTAELQPGAPAQGVTIDRGEVYAVLSVSAGGGPTPGEGNLSGSRIVADKAVAVFSGNVGAREPVIGELVCCADHLEQQMLPLEAWGQSYLTAPPMEPGGGTNEETAYRVVGGEDGITLTYTPATPPGAPTVLDAYEITYFVTDQAFTVEGSRPFGVAQFHLGCDATGGGLLGDPAMVVLPAQDQLQDTYVFLVPPTYDSNHATVLRPVGTSTTLDGAPVTEPAAPVGELGGTTYEFVQVPLTEGAHEMSGDEPFELLVYGYAAAASYAYPGGSGLEHISEPPPPPEG